MSKKTESTRSPMKTKTGKTRLGPLNYAQLKTLLEQSSRPKERAKIQRRIGQWVKIHGEPKVADILDVAE
jgi:hypothetical protein